MKDLGDALVRICELTDARMRAMDAVERDRLLQAHLAAVRGPRRNLMALCVMTDELMRARRQQPGKEMPT